MLFKHTAMAVNSKLIIATNCDVINLGIHSIITTSCQVV